MLLEICLNIFLVQPKIDIISTEDAWVSEYRLL